MRECLAAELVERVERIENIEESYYPVIVDAIKDLTTIIDKIGKRLSILEMEHRLNTDIIHHMRNDKTRDITFKYIDGKSTLLNGCDCIACNNYKGMPLPCLKQPKENKGEI